MPNEIPFLNFLCFVLLVGGLLLGSAGAGYGQAPMGEGQGTATLENWPESLPQLLDEMGHQAPYLLPRIDSLGLDYHYAATDTTSQWAFTLGWRPADRVLYEGDILPWRQGPADVRMVNVEFRAEVQVEGEPVAEMIVAVDSMALGPLPGRFTFEVTVGHDRVFLNTSAEEARRILAQGVTLGPLIVERMGFASFGAQQGVGARNERTEPSRPPGPYEPRYRLNIGGHMGFWPSSEDDRKADNAERPRRETVGRTVEGDETRRRGGDRETEGSASEDDGEDNASSRSSDARSSPPEEDDTEENDEKIDLALPAVGAAAALALVGYTAGTVGLYGRGDTPLGLAAGWTHPDGGAHLQAAVNGAVLKGTSEQALTAKALGFYDVFGARLQPALGLGVHIDQPSDGGVRPLLTAGVVANLAPVILYGGVDVVQRAPEVGITYNFRTGRTRSEAGQRSSN